MRIGCCAGLEELSVLEGSGADYIELNLSFIQAMSSERFAEALRKIKDGKLKSEAFNCFIPSGMKITGEHADLKALRDYTAKALERAALLGGERVVFGSGAARTVPEGFDPGKARDQLIAFLAMVSPIAAEHGITIAIEPLRKAETNLIHTLRDAADISRDLRLDNIRVLADLYHMADHAEPASELIEVTNLLSHVHIANPAGRTYPLETDEYDYSDFFENLRLARYNDRISIEGSSHDLIGQLPDSIRFIRAMVCHTQKGI